MFSRANGIIFCVVYLQSVAHITTIYLFIYFQVFFLNRSLIPDSPSPILDPRSSILDPDFPVHLEVLLIKIVLFFDHRSNHLFQSNQRFQAIEFVDRPVPEKLDMGFLFYGHGSTGSAVSRVRDGQVQSYPSKHIRDSYLTSEG